MTSFNDMEAIYRELSDSDITNINSTIFGWNTKGFYLNNPTSLSYDRRLGGEAGFDSLKSYADTNDIIISLHVDLVTTFEEVKKNQLAYRINSTLNTKEYTDLIFTNILNPYATLDYATEIASEIDSLGVNNLAVDKIGNSVFSFRYDGNFYEPQDTIATYIEAMNVLNEKYIGLYEANDYMFDYLNDYYDIPLSSSGYLYTTDTVPFLEIVLRGYVNYYAPYMNFNSSNEDYVLRMIEYGSYPSFILTEEPTIDMRNSFSSYLYTTEYTLWKDDIIKQYEFLNEALNEVQHERIVDHYYVMDRVSLTVYENGVTIYVNYNQDDVDINGITIEGKNYYVD